MKVPSISTVFISGDPFDRVIGVTALAALCGSGNRPYREREDSSTTPAPPRSLAKYWS